MSAIRMLGIAALVGACHVRETRWLADRNAHCDRLLAAMAAEFRDQPTIAGVGLAPLVLETVKFHPHGGGSACHLAAVAPTLWTRMWGEDPLFVDLAGTDPTYSGFQIDERNFVRDDPAVAIDPAQAIERDELGPARRDAIVEREQRSAHGRVLVTRSSGGLRLLVIRWHPDGSQRGYLRCQAYLFGRHEAALPAFEAACATARTMRWERGW